MIIHMIIFLLLLSTMLVVSKVAEQSTSSVSTTHIYKDGNTLRLPMNETATVDLLDKWLNQAFSGLITAVASSRLDQLEFDQIEELKRCTKIAGTVPQHARCVVKILDVTKPNNKYKKITRKEIKTKDVEKRLRHRKLVQTNQSDFWMGNFRISRTKRSIDIVNRSSYSIKSHNEKPILTKIIRQITKTVRNLKNKNESESWHTTLNRIKTLSTIVRKQRERRKQLKKTLQKMIANSPEKFQDPLKISAVQQMQMEDEKLLMKKKLASQKRGEIRVPMKLLRDSIKLVLAASGKNVTKFDKKTVKLASPRLLSVVPEQDDEDLLNILSPSLFSLHEDGTEEEKSMSLPNLLKELPNSDQEAWLDFITEAAGVSDTVDKAEKEYKKLAEKDMMSFDEGPLYLKKENVSDLLGSTERRKIETFEMLDRSYTIDQKEDLEKLGFAFLTTKQLDIVYGSHSPYHKSDSLRLFKKIHRRHENPHHLIERDIRALAEAKKFRVRQKDITLSPFVLTPLTFAGQALSQTITLSPLLLSPITLSPAVLGPIILSPWVFVPLVLSPRVLSPLVLSPLVFSPIILSPLVLHPLILVPGIFNPLILSPLVLSPLILSPQLFSPLILSPMVLNPLILTPIAGSPLVLSPFLLSPIIGSPLLLSSVVLSPYALSPLIESKLVTSEVILSPSWLS